MSKRDTPQEKSYIATECDKVGEIAVHYGFTVVKPPHVTTDDISKAKSFKEYDYYADSDEKVALTRWYIEENLHTQAQPIMIHYKKPLPGSASKKKPTEDMYGFEIMGSARSTSEAFLIKTALAALSDMGYKDLYVDINSIGDRESIAKFERDLGVYCRKHAHLVPAKIRQELKKNHYAALVNLSPETEEFRQTIVQPVSALSEASRLHFKEVLEYVEAFDVPYKIKYHMLSNKHYSSHTIFEVRQFNANKKDDDGTLLAYGYRYGYLAKKIGGKKDIPSIGMTLIVKKNPSFAKKILIKSIKKPSFYLVQLGSTAKLKALNVVEMLRRQKIPVYHSLTKDKITGQLTGAEYMRASHVLIIGQKEANENTVVVRNISNREQETVPVSQLSDFLKNIDKSPKALK